ncbi:MAG: hypothetical protein J6R88_02600 [Clostridia bacterium]|nr:hypothetical protein [Clostridia bacterium]
MKKYKYSFSKLIIGLFILGIVLALACIGLNVYRFVLNINLNNEITFNDWIMIILIILLSVAFIVIAVSCFISSYCTVEDKTVILAWGIIKNKLDLNEVTEIKYYYSNTRLELVFKDESYFYIAVSPEWVDDFVNDIKLANPKILYFEDSSVSEKK